MSEWQTIETAPENESILIYIPRFDHYGHGVLRAILVNMGTGRRWHSTCWHAGRDVGPEDLPTHWQPLPPPPTAS